MLGKAGEGADARPCLQREKQLGGKEVEAALIAREPIFHRLELGTSREDYAAQITDDYWEVGASGRVYRDRDFILDTLVTRGKVEGDGQWTLSEIECKAIGKDVYAFTYRLDQNGRLSRRLTLWKAMNGEWRALYHQGTLIRDEKSTILPGA